MTPYALSVVIPTYRRPAALGRTLGALAQQETGASFEVLVCDDGSPPEDAARIRALVEALGRPAPAGPVSPTAYGLRPTAYSRGPARSAARGNGPVVRVLRQEHAGPAAARNLGARAAAAPLIVFLDDDCVPAPGLLDVHLREHAKAGGVAVLGHVTWHPSLRVTPLMELVARGAQFNYGAIADAEQVPFTCFYTANCSLRRTALDAAGWFDASLPPFMEDTEFAYRLTRGGTRIVYRPEAVVHHEHAVELAPYLERQRQAGRAAVQVVLRHPELFDVVGVGSVADIALREQFYTALLRYAFVTGVEEGLGDLVGEGRITGAELRGRFERWLAGWALGEARRLRAVREHAAALEVEVARRDARLAAVTQEKDAQIALLEAQLRRLQRLPPIRLIRALKRRLAALRPNG